MDQSRKLLSDDIEEKSIERVCCELDEVSLTFRTNEVDPIFFGDTLVSVDKVLREISRKCLHFKALKWLKKTSVFLQYFLITSLVLSIILAAIGVFQGYRYMTLGSLGYFFLSLFITSFLNCYIGGKHSKLFNEYSNAVQIITKRFNEESFNQVGIFCSFRAEKEAIVGYRGKSFFKMNIAVVFFKVPPQGLAYLYSKDSQIDMKLYEELHGMSTTCGKRTEQELAKSISDIKGLRKESSKV